MKNFGSKWSFGIVVMVLGVALVIGFSSLQSAEGTYVGVDKCKMCHSSPKKGNQFGKWKESKHATAYTTLASEESKKAAAKMGIQNPQESDKCLRCHVTAFGVPKTQLDAKFSMNAGVGCESCHGPGQAHVQARMKNMKGASADTPQEVPAGEIITKPDPKVCTDCHNQQSPTFIGFNYAEDVKKIDHQDPRKK